MSTLPPAIPVRVDVASSDRRAFIKRAATIGAFAVPFVTSFTSQGGFKFGTFASAYGAYRGG